ncbi:MAG: family 10 glycosylhydrolase [Chloroflexi bacterium]|nr:family 10 glycosylhydrolase [Chloroflexota bacterium]
MPATATAVPLAAQLDPPELRALWVDAFHPGFKTPEQVDGLLAWARSANLNALFVQVRRRGDAYYLKSFEPRAEDPDLPPGFDALQYLIDRAHQGPQRLQVHAWLATLPIWYQRDTPPLAPNHQFNLHGLTNAPGDTWLMYRDDGEAWAGVGPSGTYYLDPGNPDVARYTTDVYLNLLRNYDVDGIHLDQVRYYEGDPLRWGYNPTSVARFNQLAGRDPEIQPAPTDPEWIAWRRDQVTALVRGIYLQAKALKPHVAVTAAVVTWGQGPQTTEDWERQPPFAAVLQDWRVWLQEGIVDYLLPMDYFRETAQQGPWFDRWTQWQVNHTGTRAVVLGLGSYLNSADGALAQLDRARALGALGIALYSYAVPTRDLEYAGQEDRQAFAAQLRAVFVRPAPVPVLPPPLATVAQ